MIDEIEVKNFKSYKIGKLTFSSLTILVGANASGKSNIIKSLRLLKMISTGERLGFLGDTSQPHDSLLIDELKHLGYRDEKEFQISCDIDNQEVEGWNHFEISLKIDNDREVYVTKEKIKTSSSRVPLYQITSEPQGAGSDIFVELFIEQVQKAINGDAPWTVLQVPTGEEIKNYLNEFPTYAMPGVGMGDLSIIKEWEKAKERHPYLRVFIWSLDKHLMGYDHQP